MANERKESNSIINNEELHARFVAILNAGISQSSPELEKYAWKRFSQKVDDGEVDVSVLEDNDIETVSKVCVTIKKEYFEKSGIITDEHGNPNLEVIISERPDLIETNAEVAKMVEESAIDVENIDYKKIGINELLEIMQRANPAERKYIFDKNYEEKVFTEEQEKELTEDYEKLTEKEKELVFRSDVPIEECTPEMIEFYKKHSHLDIETVDKNGKIIPENAEQCREAAIENITTKALKDWLNRNVTDEGLNPKTSKEELNKGYALLKHLSNSKTKDGQDFYAQFVLIITHTNPEKEEGLKSIEEKFKSIEKNFNPDKVNMNIGPILKEAEDGLEDFNIEEAIADNEKIYKELKKKNIETVVNFSPKQKMMYKKLKSIEIKEISTNRAHYARNAKTIVQMYHQLNDIKNPSNEQKELKEVLEFYIKLPENINAFGAYIKKGKIIQPRNDPEKESIRLDVNEVTKLREDFENIEEKEYSMEEDSQHTNNPYSRKKLSKKIEMMNQDIKIDDTIARYVVLNEKLRNIPEENIFERKLLLDELKGVEKTILDNYSIFEECVTRDNETKKYFIDDNKIDKSKYIKAHKSTEIYEACIDIVRFRDKSKTSGLQHAKEVSDKKVKLLELIEASDRREEFETLFTYTNKDGELEISEQKVISKVTELMNYVACGNAINNIENSIRKGFEFDSLSSNEKADYIENVILLISQKDDPQCQKVASLASKRIERLGVDLRDNTGQISEEKILKFYNSFVDETRKIDSSDEVYKRLDKEEKYRDLESYNMRYNMDDIKRAFELLKNPQLKRIQDIEDEINQKELDYILTPEEKLSERDRKVYEVFKKLDLNDTTNKETIINLYWASKNEYMTTKDADTYQFYKSIEKVITMDVHRIQFSEYLKSDFIVKHADEDIFNSIHLEKKAGIVEKVKNDMEKIKEKLEPYQEIIKSADDPEKFEKLLLEKTASEKKLAEEKNVSQNTKFKKENETKDKNAKNVKNPDFIRFKILKEYLKLRDVDFSDKNISPNKRVKLEKRKDNIEKRLKTDESYKQFCKNIEDDSDSTKDCFNIEAIEAEVARLEEKLEVKITPEEEKKLDKQSVEMNTSILEESKEASQEKPIQDKEIELQRQEEMNTSAITDDTVKEKKEIKVEEMVTDDVSKATDSPIINNEMPQKDEEEVDSDGKKEEQEDKKDYGESEKIENNTEEPNSSKPDTNPFVNIANSVKGFISRITTPKLTDGSEKVKNEEPQNGFLANILNKLKGTKEEKDAKNSSSLEAEQAKQESSFVPQYKIDEKAAVAKTRRAEELAKSANGEGTIRKEEEQK